jgi:hypothetical protein
VDDFALFDDEPAVLARWRARIERYLEGRCVRLHPRKTAILATAEPAAFLGFVLLPGHVWAHPTSAVVLWLTAVTKPKLISKR